MNTTNVSWLPILNSLVSNYKKLWKHTSMFRNTVHASFQWILQVMKIRKIFWNQGKNSKRRNSRIDSQLPRTVYYLHLVHAFKIHQYDCGQYRIQCYLLRPLDTDYLYPDDPNHDTSTTQIMQTALYHWKSR